MLKIFVRNDNDHIMSLSRKVKLKMIIDYEAAKCYVIDFFEHDLVTKASKRSPNWIKSDLRKLIAAVAAFIAVMTFIAAEEVHVTEITLHDTSEARFSIFAVTNDFSSLW